MPILTDTELARLRRKIGDINDPPIFAEDELQDIWDESGEDWNKTVLYAFDELIGNHWKFADYSQGQSEEKRSQVMANLIKARKVWQGKVDKDAEVVTANQQVIITGLDIHLHRRKNRPRA